LAFSGEGEGRTTAPCALSHPYHVVFGERKPGMVQMFYLVKLPGLLAKESRLFKNRSNGLYFVSWVPFSKFLASSSPKRSTKITQETCHHIVP
jgi:hypothetical protein